MKLILPFIILISINIVLSAFLPIQQVQNTIIKDTYKAIQIDRIQKAVKDESSDLHHLAYNRLAWIVDTYGPRMWGSRSQELAVDDLFKQIQGLGFDKVYKQNLGSIKTWKRSEEFLTLHEPRPVPFNLTMIGLGLGASGDVTAEVIVVKTFEELDALGKEKVQGKIVLFNEEWINYGETVKYRSRGPSSVQNLGGVGMLLRSVASFSINNPHTGATHYNELLPLIPAVAITLEDADMLQRMQDRGQKIVVHLHTESEWYESTSDNIIAEITGSELPNEVIVLGGHFDSWDTGSQTGANDDGGGVMSCLEALHVLQSLGIRPKRTLRFIAWSGEEMGLPKNGAEVYANYALNNKEEKHILAFESDAGNTKPYGFGFDGNTEATKIIHQLASTYLQSVNAEKIVDGDGESVDSGYLGELGVPMMRNLIKDNETEDFYFTYHHSAGDSMYMMNAEDLDDNVIAIASMLFLVADNEVSLPNDIKNQYI